MVHSDYTAANDFTTHNPGEVGFDNVTAIGGNIAYNTISQYGFQCASFYYNRYAAIGW